MATSSICFFISSLTKPAGTERVCTEIANKLSQLGFVVSILRVYNGKPFFTLHNNVKLISIYNGNSSSKLKVPVTIMRLRQRLLNINPDILVNVDSALYVYSSIAAIGLKGKNVVWEHFNYNAAKHSIARVISRKLAAKYSNAVITLTEADNIAWKKSQRCKIPVITINNPSPIIGSINVGRLPERKDIVLSIGRLSHQKGFDQLLDAWHTFKTNSKNSGWELYIVGSGELKEELEQKIKDLELTSSVRLIKATADVYKYYQQAGIYCLSSRYEGFPMVLLEAQAFGLPVITFDCPTGPAEIVEHGKTGLLVKNGDIDNLAQAISFLINDDSMRLVMSNNAIKRSLSYSIDTIIKDWQKLFAAILCDV